MYPLDDTIAAIASPAGGGLRGIVRISGPQCRAVIRTIATLPPQWEDAVAACCLDGHIHLEASLDRVPLRLYYWPTQRSYTREPTAELHLPGSPPLLAAVLGAVCACGARLAQPGEFTLRAFLAGRLDLTQAEAVLGVIDANDRQELAVALEQLGGGVAQPLAQLRERLLDLLAQLEASLDFVEEDIRFVTTAELEAGLSAVEARIEQLLGQLRDRTSGHELPRVVLYGMPNAGKSSLLNALVQSQAALVSDTAGTTRDYLACRVLIQGHELILSDTAGIGESSDAQGRSLAPLEEAAQRATAAEVERADLLVLCIDGTRPLEPWERQQFQRDGRPVLVVLTKVDLPAATQEALPQAVLRTSSATGWGLATLQDAIVGALESLPRDLGVTRGTAQRCRDSLGLAAEAIARARIAVRQEADELTAAEIRVALSELGRIVGAVYTDDILDRVFSRFCIGK